MTQAQESSIETPIISSSRQIIVMSRIGKGILYGLSLAALIAATVTATNVTGYIARKYDMPRNVGTLMAEDTCKRVTEEFDASAWYNKLFQYGSKEGCEAFLEHNRSIAYK
jgi:hypothetical protein